MSATSRSDPVDGSFSRYLEEIGRYPLIDRAEEVRLAVEAREGNDEALDQLVRANLRFVVKVAKRYRNQGVPLQDLVNEGNLGLMRAARKFDERRGIKFITYAVWWIRQAILQAIAEQSRIVRVPLNRSAALHRIGRRKSSLRQDLGREPTLHELADGLELSQGVLDATLAVSQSHLSLDAPAGPGDENSLLDYLPDQLSPRPDEQVFESALTEMLDSALSTLEEREARVLRLYYGLDAEEPKTLEEIGAVLSVTRERVRQIKERALARLRHPTRARFLESYFH